MIMSKDVNVQLQNNILDGIKTPHSTSYPVLYYENEKYYLACFVFFFTQEDIETGKVGRPTVWVIADIKTGKIIEERQTKEKEFSNAAYDVKYDVHTDGDYDTSKQYYEKAFHLLDSVRSKIIKDGKLCKRDYQDYLNMILGNIPKEYQRFYTDLSV